MTGSAAPSHGCLPALVGTTVAQEKFTYAHARDKPVPHLSFDMRNHDLSDETVEFFEVADVVENVLLDDKDVLAHCVQSHHRAPICLAALMRRILGVTVRVFGRF